ncbi:MAG TPA: hypothetical protein PLL00_08890 [Bacteroidia bacterium]|nr:hypothetical protein [Bacteroidia bacterium]
MPEYRIKLAYDANAGYYEHGHNLRIELIKFLLRNGAFNLNAYVSSTISFSFLWNTNPLYFWEGTFLSDFVDDFYYQISLIQPSDDENPEFSTKAKPRNGFVNSFETDITRAQNQIREAGVEFNDD